MLNCVFVVYTKATTTFSQKILMGLNDTQRLILAPSFAALSLHFMHAHLA